MLPRDFTQTYKNKLLENKINSYDPEFHDKLSEFCDEAILITTDSTSPESQLAILLHFIFAANDYYEEKIAGWKEHLAQITEKTDLDKQNEECLFAMEQDSHLKSLRMFVTTFSEYTGQNGFGLLRQAEQKPGAN